MPNYAENLAQAKQWVEKAKEAEKRKDWVDALACLEKAHDLSIGDPYRDDVVWKEYQRVRQLSGG